MTQDSIPPIDILQRTEDFIAILTESTVSDGAEVREIINGAYAGVGLAELLEIEIEMEDSLQHARRQRKEINLLYGTVIDVLEEALRFTRERQKETEDELRKAAEDNRESTESDTA